MTGRLCCLRPAEVSNGKGHVLSLKTDSLVQEEVMANFSELTAREELRHAIIELRSRRLDQAAKWAAEQLVGLPPTDDCQRGSCTSQAARETPVSDLYLLAMSHFDHKVRWLNSAEAPLPCFPASKLRAIRQVHSKFNCALQEYKRAAHVLQQEAGNKPFFLRMYSLYLAGEKRKE